MEANVSPSLQITPKGVDEVQHRVYKLNIRKRSVLILLDKPQTIEQVLHRTVFPEQEIVEEIQTLVRDGFIEMSRGGAQIPAAPAPAPLPPPSAGGFALLDDIIISEAKFQLVDFCVDSFGTRSQAFVDEIRACKNAQEIDLYLRHIVATAEKLCPERLPLLQSLVKEINATA